MTTDEKDKQRKKNTKIRNKESENRTEDNKGKRGTKNFHSRKGSLPLSNRAKLSRRYVQTGKYTSYQNHGIVKHVTGITSKHSTAYM